MSLSITAALVAAVRTCPDLVVLSRDGAAVTIGDLEVRSRAIAGAALLGGRRPGERVRIAAGDLSARVAAFLGAARVGLVVLVDPELSVSALAEPGEPPPHIETVLGPAEQDVWSETPALGWRSGRLMMHGELIMNALESPPARAVTCGESPPTDLLASMVVAAVVHRRSIPVPV